LVPTKRRRHAITETEPVQAALDELRRELGSDRVELGELVVLGAGVKLAALRAQDSSDAELRRRLADRVRARQPLADRDAAELVRRSGWARG
jgi:GAF domain-containing protein